jgi:hypothetical protein
MHTDRKVTLFASKLLHNCMGFYGWEEELLMIRTITRLLLAIDILTSDHTISKGERIRFPLFE